MADMQIVRELAAHYAQLADDRDFAGFAEIMTDDFEQRGEGWHFRSREEFLGGLEMLRQYDRTLHVVGQSRGQWQGERYQGETWCIASHLYTRDGIERKMDMGIRYRETIVRSGDLWKYRERDLNVVWTQDLPVQG